MKQFGFKKYSQIVDEKRHPTEFKKGIKKITVWAARVGREDLDYIHKRWGHIAVIGEYILLKPEGTPEVWTSQRFHRRFYSPSIIG